MKCVRSEDGVDFADPSFWTTIGGEAVGEGWEFEDGEIRLVEPRGGKGSIISKPVPANFELSFEWKIDAGTNTGLKYRVRRFGKHMFSNSYLGIEYQIIDDLGKPLSKGSTASIYDLVEPKYDEVLKPAGQWNRSKIRADDYRIEHYLNDQLVASALTAGPAWDKKIAFSKFYGAANFGLPQEGDRIMLTDHGGRAAYRNFNIEAAAAVGESNFARETGPFLANALRNSWVDQDSIVLWTRTTELEEFVADGKPFMSVSNRDARKLSKLRDEKLLLEKQIPDGAELSEMFGACPGMPGFVRLSYFPARQRKAIKTTDWVATEAEDDFTAQWKLTGLKADTEYAVVVEARKAEEGPVTAVVRGAFRTAPRINQSRSLKFCMTTCHDFIRRDDGLNGHKIYPAMEALAPDFVVHAGDIEYYDKPDPWALTVDLMRFKWGRIFALPNNRNFYANTSSYFLKDDHDTLKNDCWPGQYYGAVSFETGQQIFNSEQFPSLEPRYKTVRWGRDIQVWFLEGRDYRSPNSTPDGPEKTILGREQKDWLFETLEASESKFKIIFSPTPIVGPDRENKQDNHANNVFEYEGREIREFLGKQSNVIVLCGDRHWQYASFDEDLGLWEFGCGPGSEKHQLGWKVGDERPVHKFLRVKGGFLSGELKAGTESVDSVLLLRHHSVSGKQVSEFRFPAAESSN